MMRSWSTIILTNLSQGLRSLYWPKNFSYSEGPLTLISEVVITEITEADPK